jgi:hypothetical protein
MPAPKYYPDQECAAEGCSTKHKNDRLKKGYCSKHYTRLLNLGSVEDSALKYGPHGRENISYVGAHRRVYRAKGKAPDYTCELCGEQAEDWSYNYKDVNEFETIWDGRLIRYSTDVSYYVPLCKRCHKNKDNYIRVMGREVI